MIEPHEILLIDDDDDNVRLAREFGHAAMDVSEDIDMTTIQDFARNLVVHKREPTVQSWYVKKALLLNTFAESHNAYMYFWCIGFIWTASSAFYMLSLLTG